jgi:hypothetical protein
MTIPDYDICDCGVRGVHSKCRPEKQEWQPEQRIKEAINIVERVAAVFYAKDDNFNGNIFYDAANSLRSTLESFKYHQDKDTKK